ncbi:ATP-binding protein [Caloramator proteoclasticus]|uniref:MinD superfamily P-loop ATPase, contains an inserted ferredoxin domain n=1 Tax=Caloramator proteoclasticus DSM 10124 TaxID=1121262 RepID=A0A1M4UH94_9CLOT|nr:ATP-binding protein [Caloramator proteoclasticus]SHE56024.1 MinD superfamily P-loop ATPase, contains an inserted ferredoxin domain [Caloramator proteoclasticus DSM 10124]
MELVILSGKGGTGKTTIATALSELAKDVMRVDCDVDAPNFYLYYQGQDVERKDFIGSKKAFIDKSKCVKCGICKEICRFDAIDIKKDQYFVDSFSCEGCGLCTIACNFKAISMQDEKTADVYITKIEKGLLSRAQMEIGADGSGKLITELRENAKRYNKENKLTIIDGSPGIGCPVISSITGSNAALIVTEPSKSGLEDLKRVYSLCKHFKIMTFVCINKYDINIEVANDIEEFANNNNITIVGKIPFDEKVMESINNLKPITEYEESRANKAIREMWEILKSKIN